MGLLLWCKKLLLGWGSENLNCEDYFFNINLIGLLLQIVWIVTENVFQWTRKISCVGTRKETVDHTAVDGDINAIKFLVKITEWKSSMQVRLIILAHRKIWWFWKKKCKTYCGYNYYLFLTECCVKDSKGDSFYK